MKLVQLDTLRFAAHPNLLVLRLHTDEGVIGLGETFFGARSVEAYLHESAAATLLGRDPTAIRALERELADYYVGYLGTGAETRGNSAVNLALWDIVGRSLDRPVHELLGGPVRDDLHVYNTCAGYGYVQHEPSVSSSNWALPEDRVTGPYEDLEGFLHRPEELARSLRDERVSGMKIWPFDEAAERTGGTHIPDADLAQGVEIVARIREAVGHDIDVMVELHGLWYRPAAERIARALEPYEPYWIEDPLRGDDLEALAALTASTPIPIAMGETLAGRPAYRRLLDLRAVDIAIVDPVWTGGLSEAVRVADLAETAKTPVATHDCTGPIAFAACVHFSMSQPGALIQETVRAFHSSWYADLATNLPPIVAGRVSAPPGPGLGVELQPDLDERPGVTVTTSTVRDRS